MCSVKERHSIENTKVNISKGNLHRDFILVVNISILVACEYRMSDQSCRQGEKFNVWGESDGETQAEAEPAEGAGNHGNGLVKFQSFPQSIW